MKILGIDPGIGRTGWGVIEAQGSKFSMINCGCIETKVNGLVHERLLVMYEEIQKLLEEYQSDEVAIEELFFNTNAKTALVVGQARGVVLLAAAQKQIPITSYTPLQVKQAVTGYGKAEKGQVGQMVKMLLQLEKLPRLDDTTDALAIAITHGFSRRMGKYQ